MSELALDLYCKDAVIRTLEDGDIDTKLKIFQILDTYEWYYTEEGVYPVCHSLPLSEEMKFVALYIEGFVRSRPAWDWAEDVASMDHLRPDGQRLPLLHILSSSHATQFSTAADTDSHTIGTIPFSSYSQAMLEDARFQQGTNKKGKTAGVKDCTDFSLDVDDQQKLVAELVQAMVDFSKIVEKKRVVKPRKTIKAKANAENSELESVPVVLKDNYRVERVNKTSRREQEMLGWKILHYIKEAQDGNIFLPDRYRRKAKYEQYDTFRARFDKVLVALKGSKAWVDDLMLWDPARRLVAAPVKEYGKKDDNQRVNEQKAKKIAIGTEVLLQQEATKKAAEEAKMTVVEAEKAADKATTSAAQEVTAAQEHEMDKHETPDEDTDEDDTTDEDNAADDETDADETDEDETPEQATKHHKTQPPAPEQQISKRKWPGHSTEEGLEKSDLKENGRPEPSAPVNRPTKRMKPTTSENDWMDKFLQLPEED